MTEKTEKVNESQIDLKPCPFCGCDKIDEDHINLLIDQKRAFKIGARGIAVSFFYSDINHLWMADVGRASCMIRADVIGVCDDVDFYVLEMSYHDQLIAEFNLSEFDKLTVIG